MVRLHADGYLPHRTGVLAVDRIGKPQEHGTLPGAVGRDLDAALHSPLLRRGMG